MASVEGQDHSSHWLQSDDLKALRESWAAFADRQQAEDQAWWDSLSYEDRAQAFRHICKLMYQAEVRDRGSYRWAIDVFGLDYGDGLDHYMALHNLISQAMEERESIKRVGDA